MKNNKQVYKRIAALAGVILLAALYLLTLVSAFMNSPNSGRLFQASLVATVAVPILIWIYIWLFGKIKDKHTMASFDLGKDQDEE